MDENLFFGTNLADWLRLNSCNSKVCSSSSVSWDSVFPFDIWSLWLHRNETIFQNTRNQRCLKAEVLSRAIEYAYIGINSKQARSKLNFDGSSLGNLGLAGGGGLIWDDKGDWIKGYARAIRTTTSVVVELWALRDSIKLCIALKIPAVIIELDAQVVVDLLKKNTSHSSGIGALVSDCKHGFETRTGPYGPTGKTFNRSSLRFF